MQEILNTQGDHPGQALPSRSHFIWLVIMAIVALVCLLAATLPARGASPTPKPAADLGEPTPTPLSGRPISHFSSGSAVGTRAHHQVMLCTRGVPQQKGKAG